MPAEVAETVVYRRSLQPRERAAAISELAGLQHGVVGRGQLVAIGVPVGAIERGLRTGTLHRLFPRVYAVGHLAVGQRGRWMAAVLASTPDAAGNAAAGGDHSGRAVLSHRSAGALWGIRGYSGAPIDVTVRGKRHGHGAIRRHAAALPTDEMTVRDGIPVTTMPRTIFDLAAETCDQSVVEACLRQAEYSRLSDPLSLWDLLARYPGHRGCRAVRAGLERLADAPPGRPRKGLEERFLAFLDRYRLPRPLLNALVDTGSKSYEVDCLWSAQRQIAELDSWKAHGTRTGFRTDRTRDRRLHAAGYTVTRITWAQLDDEPAEIAADLRVLLAYKRT